MKCKNCQNEMSVGQPFCDQCGAKWVEERFTIKRLLNELVHHGFGWDNKFFFTTRELVLRPQNVIKEYLSGTRKKYFAPFAYFALTLAVSVIIFNIFQNTFVHSLESMFVSSEINVPAKDTIDSESIMILLNDSISNSEKVVGIDSLDRKMQNPFEFEGGATTMLKYYNLMSFLNLPFYALLTFLVFGKPYNFAEHLIINTFAQGLIGLASVALFLVAFFTSLVLYSYGATIFSIIFYIYLFGKVYGLNAKQNIVKFLKFLALALALLISLSILVVIAVFIYNAIWPSTI